ncbi:DUF2194 domain-containing protein [Bacillus sp. 3255]|uniref:DUF2194 domain-containing protein n=1 Tax=Bacillus sp. 3255 TaxID=2817904 RepID=UPI00285BC1EE|nr:DUF2194 domain-containing protein [Bacillus sp. 3255]MDR6885374.1 hypothetical protein [Bacillus sp. 3255]
MSRKLITLSCVIVSMLVLGVMLQTMRVVDVFPLSPSRYVFKEAPFTTKSSQPAFISGAPLGLSLYVNPKDTEGLKVRDNLEHALALAKLPWDTIAAEDLATLKPGPWTALLLMGEDVSGLDLNMVQTYVRQGGRLLVYTRFYAPAWNGMFGIAANNGYFPGSNRGITVNQTVFPGYPNLPPTNLLFSNNMLDVKLQPEAEVYLTSQGTPLLWTYVYGQGKVVYWNSTASAQKEGRGLMVQSIGLAVDSLVTSQVAARSLNIDDFPSPVPQVDNPLIHREYGLSTPAFYERIWWEDMVRISKLYGWKYTGLIIGTYQNRTEPPLPSLLDGTPELIPYFGSRLLGLGGEIGLHGYNHQSLVTADEPIKPELGYVPWPNQAAMAKSLRRLTELTDSLFPGHELKTYVPPSNVMNRTGKMALAEAAPSIDILSSLYSVGGEKGFLEQEFGVDSEFPQFTNYPRISSGYAIDEGQLFFINDAIANFGLVNHFVHPDDALDIQRSGGKGWKYLIQHFEGWMSWLNKTYPYLEPLTVRDAVKKFSLYEAGTADVHYGTQSITITTKDQLIPMHYTVRVPARLVPQISKESGNLTPLDEKEGIWHLEARQPTVNIQLKESSP